MGGAKQPEGGEAPVREIVRSPAAIARARCALEGVRFLSRAFCRRHRFLNTRLVVDVHSLVVGRIAVLHVGFPLFHSWILPYLPVHPGLQEGARILLRHDYSVS